MAQPNFPQTPAISTGKVFTPTDSTTAQAVYTAPSDKSVMVGRIRATSNDTAERTFVVSRVNGALTLNIGTFTSPLVLARPSVVLTGLTSLTR